MKIITSGYQNQTLECFIATLPTYGVYGRLVHARVVEAFNRFADFGLWIARDKNTAGLRSRKRF